MEVFHSCWTRYQLEEKVLPNELDCGLDPTCKIWIWIQILNARKCPIPDFIQNLLISGSQREKKNAAYCESYQSLTQVVKLQIWSNMLEK